MMLGKQRGRQDGQWTRRWTDRKQLGKDRYGEELVEQEQLTLAVLPHRGSFDDARRRSVSKQSKRSSTQASLDPLLCSRQSCSGAATTIQPARPERSHDRSAMPQAGSARPFRELIPLVVRRATSKDRATAARNPERVFPRVDRPLLWSAPVLAVAEVASSRVAG